MAQASHESRVRGSKLLPKRRKLENLIFLKIKSTLKLNHILCIAKLLFFYRGLSLRLQACPQPSHRVNKNIFVTRILLFFSLSHQTYACSKRCLGMFINKKQPRISSYNNATGESPTRSNTTIHTITLLQFTREAPMPISSEFTHGPQRQAWLETERQAYAAENPGTTWRYIKR